jgi:hypothetical protein
MPAAASVLRSPVDFFSFPLSRFPLPSVRWATDPADGCARWCFIHAIAEINFPSLPPWHFLLGVYVWLAQVDLTQYAPPPLTPENFDGVTMEEHLAALQQLYNDVNPEKISQVRLCALD